MKKVVIIGGGFGGLSAAKKLNSDDFEVTLIDRRNYHLFQPLLYQIATAALSPADIAYPLRSLVKGPNTEVLLGEVSQINKEEKWIKTKEGLRIEFDYLILACGSTYTYFNSPQFKQFAPGLKNVTQATEIRKQVLLAFERAERESNPSLREANLNFVVVGGGPTGVELAGALAEIATHSLIKDFHHINTGSAKIILIEAGPRILASMDKESSTQAEAQLRELGVEVRTNTKVVDINENGITIGTHEFINSKTILWAAGVASVPLNKELGVDLDRQGRVIVEKDCSIKNFPSIFVIGDQARYEYGPEQTPLPGLASVAMQQGRYVAKVIKNESLRHSPVRPKFKYVDKGQMATIGRSRAVAMYRGIQISGFLAWISWLFVHIYYLIGFKNRISVMFQWAWTYFTYRRSARLIIED